MNASVAATGCSLRRSGSHITSRLLQMIPVLLVIVVINFVLVRAAPGDPTLYLVGDAPVTDEYIASLKERLGLDRSLVEQLGIYLANASRGDLGYSYISQEPVSTLIFSRLPATLLLMGTQYVLSIIVGVMLGVISARRQSGTTDTVVTVFSVVGYALPVFWLGQILVLIFALRLGSSKANRFCNSTSTSGIRTIFSLRRLLPIQATPTPFSQSILIH